MKSKRKAWLNLVYVLFASLILSGCGTYSTSPDNTQFATNQPIGMENDDELQSSGVNDNPENPSADEGVTDSEVTPEADKENGVSDLTEAPLPTTEPVATEAPPATPVPTKAPTPTPKPTSTPVPKPTATPIPTKAPVVKPVTSPEEIARAVSFDVSSVPVYNGSAYAVVNGNTPFFTKEHLVNASFEYYSPLDSIGRCGTCVASIGCDIMPTEDRGEIGSVKPSGWNQAKYSGLVDGNYLYNRCHLIGFQLTGENANTKNLITGTRYFNVDGMLPFENMVADYVKESRNHVMYRVTPVYEGKNLLANGVLIEAYSVEDEGEGICFCVYCYNVQPGVTISYSDGSSCLLEEEEEPAEVIGTLYVLNTNTKKFHYASCSSAKDIKDSNRDEFTGDRQALIDNGYSACKRCNP